MIYLGIVSTFSEIGGYITDEIRFSQFDSCLVWVRGTYTYSGVPYTNRSTFFDISNFSD